MANNRIIGPANRDDDTREKKGEASHFNPEGWTNGFILSEPGGCSRGIKNDPVDPPKAKELLRTALESWKKGEEIASLQSGTSPIYVIDPDWQPGIKLREFEIVGEGDAVDAQWVCKVRITPRSATGQETKREVVFTFSTAPNQMVSRKLF